MTPHPKSSQSPTPMGPAIPTEEAGATNLLTLTTLRLALAAEIEANAPYRGDRILDGLTAKAQRYVDYIDACLAPAANRDVRIDEAVWRLGPNMRGPLLARLIAECAQQRRLAGVAAMLEAAE